MSSAPSGLTMASLEAAGRALQLPSEKQVSSSSSDSDSSSDSEMQPYPFFHYKDFSRERDPDPSKKLNASKGANNFPAKMHIILSDPELEDIVGWLPHGRSWRILRPREFERKVIPAMFEHTKFSSFIRQANGWGFRRVIQG